MKVLLTVIMMGMVCLAGCSANESKKGCSTEMKKECMATCGKGVCKLLPKDCHPTPMAYPGWRVGMQAYTFKEFTFFEAVDKTAALGLHWIEAYPSQKVSAEMGEVKFAELNPMQQVVVKRKLAEAGVTLVNYGVVGLGKDEAENRKVFEFAKAMGIETICSEPEQEALPMVDKLAQEYKINVALHNHPEPSRYWDPKVVLAACEGRSQFIGACADTGHWTRSGINPVDAIRMLKGRIISLHLKDLNEFGKKDAHDVPWGTGVSKVGDVLKELNAQRFKGVFSIEYEYNWQNSSPEIRQGVNYFDKTAAAIKSTGWKNLTADGLENFTDYGKSWAFNDGVLERLECKDSPDKDLFGKEQYGDFILDLEFKTAEKSNSGVFIRVANPKEMVQTGIEIQVLDSFGRSGVDTHDCGAVYDCLAPSENMVRAPGQWNRMTVTAVKNKIYVVLNGKGIIDMDLDKWTQAEKNPDGTKNKFKTAYKAMPRKGCIVLQNHESPIWYRNIWIKSLD